MFCAISGEVPTEPVVSKTGHLFEKRLIEKFLESEDKCPVTGEPLTKEDLVVLQATQTPRPRPITATSIPGLLSHFQNEWDATMLELFTTKKHLDTTRKELSQVLYQHDAACRVIARLVRERDEARAMLADRQHHVAQAAAGESMDVEAPTGITEAILGQMASKGKELSKSRKKRPIPSTLATPDAIKSFSCKTSATPHASSKQAVTCVDLHPENTSITVSGGVDKAVLVYDHSQSKIAASLEGHSKRVNAVKFHPNGSTILSASSDNTAKIWSASSSMDFTERSTIAVHDKDVTGISIHPTGDYFVTSSQDSSWSFCSLEYGTSLKRITDDSISAGFTSIQFHPDGLIVGMGDEANTVRMWDMKTQGLIHTFEGHSGPVTSLDFSENGYYMASTGADGTARLWDLRKLKNLKTMELPGAGHSVKFDYSGTFLAIAAKHDVLVNVVKEWDTLTTLSGHSKDVTGVAFSKDANVLASVGNDRAVKLWGP